MTSIAKVDLDLIEMHMLVNAPNQVPCHVIHHFGPEVYIREVTIPKGTMALGHSQRFDHLNVVLSGAVAVYEDGVAKVVQGPCVFVGKKGRKIGVCIEECVWQNIYPNYDNCKDIEELERRWLEKSSVATMYENIVSHIVDDKAQKARSDYSLLLSELGMTDEQVRSESFSIDDMVDLPSGYATRLSVRDSKIQGRGLFLSSPAKPGEIIAPGRIGKNRTIAGRYVNHSNTPNCTYRIMSDDIYLVAKEDIHGAIGGSAGCELTVDYRYALSLSKEIRGIA